jgi:hypothetical protein
MRLLRKSGEGPQIILGRAEKAALAKTIETCSALAEWLGDDQADGAAGVLSRIQDHYVGEKEGTDGK